MSETYRVVRFYQDPSRDRETVSEGLTLDEAREHCNDPETSYSTATSDEATERTRERGPWFDGYEEE